MKNIKTFCLELAWIIAFVHVTSSLNLGLISGDLRRTSNPLIIKKNSHHAPITINIKPGLPSPLKLTPPSLPKLTSSPLATKRKIKRRLKSAIKSRKLKLPKLPKLPLLPLIPPVLPPPILPKLPLLPLPLLPILPSSASVRKLLKPLRVSILKSKLQKALGSEVKPVKVPAPNLEGRKLIRDKLVKLRRSGALTTPEFLRFKKLLL